MKNFQIVIIYQNDFYIVVLHGKPLHFECRASGGAVHLTR